MIGPAEAVGVAVVVCAAVGLLSFMLLIRARTLGHPPGVIRLRLAILWAAVAGAAAVGLYLRLRFPQGALDLNPRGLAQQEPLLSLPAEGQGLMVLLGLAGMALCAAAALWAISALQRSPAGAEADPADLAALEEGPGPE